MNRKDFDTTHEARPIMALLCMVAEPETPEQRDEAMDKILDTLAAFRALVEQMREALAQVTHLTFGYDAGTNERAVYDLVLEEIKRLAAVPDPEEPRDA